MTAEAWASSSHPVVHLLVFVAEHCQRVVLQRHAGHDADGAVEHSCGALLVVVPQSGDLVAEAEHPSAIPPFRLYLPVRGERLLQQQVQVPGVR